MNVDYWEFDTLTNNQGHLTQGLVGGVFAVDHWIYVKGRCQMNYL